MINKKGCRQPICGLSSSTNNSLQQYSSISSSSINSINVPVSNINVLVSNINVPVSNINVPVSNINVHVSDIDVPVSDIDVPNKKQKLYEELLCNFNHSYNLYNLDKSK